MVSVIISSANKELLTRVSLNIQLTIGVPYEILAFDNSDGKKGICEVYNSGASKANFDVLCFMHEDLEIKTKNWGRKIIEDFDHHQKLGVVGVVGSSYKSFVPSGWGVESYESDLIFYNYVQHYKYVERPQMKAYSNANDVELQNVVVLDGMWFCTRKEIALKFPFDEETFKGFHCYDLDYCLNVGQYYDIAVTFNVLMEHFSEGNYSKEWFLDTLKLQNKWENSLPRKINEIDTKLASLIEKRGYKRLLLNLVYLGFSLEYIFKFLNKFRIKTNMSFAMYLKLSYYLITFWYKKRKMINR